MSTHEVKVKDSCIYCLGQNRFNKQRMEKGQIQIELEQDLLASTISGFTVLLLM